MQAELEGLRSFASEWQRKPWAIMALPTEIGARVIYEEGDPLVLGVAVTARAKRRACTIGLNKLVLQSPLYLPVLAHECAHCVLGHSAGLCENGWIRSQVEQAAWFGGAFLAVSEAQCHLTIETLAEQNSIPLQFAALGLAVHSGNSALADQRLSEWLDYVHYQSNKLRRLFRRGVRGNGMGS